MTKIVGIEGLTPDQLRDEIQKGGRFVVFLYCISVVILTFKQSSEIHFIRAGQGTFGKSFVYTLVSLFAGWWGIPWGPIYTLEAVFTNLGGGKNVTPQVLTALGLPGLATAVPKVEEGKAISSGPNIVAAKQPATSQPKPEESPGTSKRRSWLGWILTLAGGLSFLLGGLLFLLFAAAELFGSNRATDHLTRFIGAVVICPVPLLIVGLILLAAGIFTLRARDI